LLIINILYDIYMSYLAVIWDHPFTSRCAYTA